MDNLETKYQQLSKMALRLEKSLQLYDSWHSVFYQKSTRHVFASVDYDQIKLSLRDASIFHFKITTDLLWKFLKIYLEQKFEIIPDIVAPKTIIREACKARVLSEAETETILAMIKNRNLTSHMYHQELAEMLLDHLGGYLACMQQVLAKIELLES